LAILPAVFLVAAAAWGQEHPDGFYLTTPLGLSSGYDSGFLAKSGRLNDGVTLLSGPTFDWIHTTHRSFFSLDYQPEGEIFARNGGLDAWNHASTMRFSYQLSSRTSFDAGNSFLSTTDSSRALQNSLLLLPMGRFIQNTFFSDLKYRIDSADKLTFRFDNAVTTMDLPGPLKWRLDEVTTAGTVTLDRALTSRQTLSGDYAFLHVSPLHPESVGTGTNVNLFILGYSYQVTPTLLLRATAGGVAGSESAFNGSAAIEKQWGGLWLAAGYQRYIGFFGGYQPAGGPTAGTIPFAYGLTPNSVYQVASLRASGQISKHWGLEAVGQKALNGRNSQGVGVRSLIGQLRISYRLTGRYTVFARAEHYGQNVNEFSGLPLSRNRYLIGLEMALSKPPVAEEPGKHRKGAAEPEEIKPPELPGMEGR
jgi:hypothetical protein